MADISQRDAAALLEVVDELARLDDPAPFPPRVLELLARLVGNDEAGYSVLDRRNERSVSYDCWIDGVELGGGESDDDRYWRLRHSHPCCSYRERNDEWTTPHSVSDFATLRQFRRTAIWNEVYRTDGIDYWLDVGLSPRHGCTRVFVFARGACDYSERDKLLLSLLQPHLERRAAAVEAAAEAVDALAAASEASRDIHDVVLLSGAGTIEFASPHTRELLRRYTGVTNGKLPAALSNALRGGVAVAHDEDGGQLTIRSARAGELTVLLLAEHDGRVAQLTPRQRDVLTGVREGLSDVEIAERLGIATATVGKHLEGIYDRLDVHNRTAAAAVLRG